MCFAEDFPCYLVFDVFSLSVTKYAYLTLLRFLASGLRMTVCGWRIAVWALTHDL